MSKNHENRSPNSSVAELVLKKMLSAIFDGSFGPGYRLPSERDISLKLGASRVSVREALQHLKQWQVIVTKHGSGAVVRPRRHWTAGVITYLLLHHLERGEWDAMLPVISDAFAVRRNLLLEMMVRAAGRTAPGALDPARELLHKTWVLRDDLYRFAVSDLQMINKALEIAGMHASVWTLNSLSGPYLGLASMVSSYTTLRIPGAYVPAHLAVFAAQEKGDGEGVRTYMEAFLDELDLGIVSSMPAEMGGIEPVSRAETNARSGEDRLNAGGES